MQFADMGLSPAIRLNLVELGYDRATPIQAQAIPHAMTGVDVLGCAQTGTGKTAAFAIPILHRLAIANRKTSRFPRVLVLAPTRELATQIADGFRDYGRGLDIRRTVIFGGVNQNPQVDALRRGTDVIIATPGRLMDLMNQGHVNLKEIETLILDEADRMLDMGFIHDIRKIVSQLPQEKQVMMFTATMPSEIRKLADQLMRDPVRVEIAKTRETTPIIEESLYYVQRGEKTSLLVRLFDDLPIARGIVFTRTKHGADKLVKSLGRYDIRAEAIHGNKSQNARQRALDNFRRGKTALLIATDVAARGIDVDDVTHVVQYDLTDEPETYVHRIGRTGRAGAKGNAVAFCDSDEKGNLRDIEKLIKRKIPTAKIPEGEGSRQKREPVGQASQSRDERDEGQRRSAPHHQGRGQEGRGHETRSHEPRAQGNRFDPRRREQSQQERPQPKHEHKRGEHPLRQAEPRQRSSDSRSRPAREGHRNDRAPGKPAFGKPAFAKPKASKPSVPAHKRKGNGKQTDTRPGRKPARGRR